MVKSTIIEYLKKVKSVFRHQLIDDIQSLGLKLKGRSPSGKFMEFIDQHGQVRVKIHAPDQVTNYPHLHLYHQDGSSLDSHLRRMVRKSPDAHIEIQ